MTLQRVLTVVFFLIWSLVFATLFLRSLQAPLGVDQGYNLEVVDNLARGKGYASYGAQRLDAWWSAKRLIKTPQLQFTPFDRWPFDPRVTTGPAVLVPMSLVWRWSRGSVLLLRLGLWLFAFAFFWLLWRLCPEKNPLAFFSATAFLASLWFGFQPGSLLGEVPGSTFVLAALQTWQRPLWAGLLMGLAVESKVLYLIPMGTALAFQLFTEGQRWAGRLRRLWIFSCGFSLPVGGFELFRLLSLGSLREWRASWEEFFAFTAEQTTAAPSDHLLRLKLSSLQARGPGWYFLAALGLALLLVLWRRSDGTHKEQAPFAIRALTVAGSTTFAFWLVGSIQQDYRQALPALLLGAPGLLLLSSWWDEVRWPRARQGLSLLIPVALALGLAFCLVTSLYHWFWRDLTPYWPGGGLRAQLRIAELVRQTGVEGISPLVGRLGPFAALTAVPVASCPDSNQVLIVTPWARRVERKPKEHYLSLCTQVLADTEDALVCLPKSLPMSEQALPITQWGPQHLQVGDLPNPQPKGDGALWFRLDKPQELRPKLVLVLNGQPVGLVVWGRDGQSLSGPVPRSWVSKPGPVAVELLHLCLSYRQWVGYLQVDAGGV